MIERELNDDMKSKFLHSRNSHKVGKASTVSDGKRMIIIDYGSNYGYFSLQMAQKFPNATVVSLEGEAWKGTSVSER